MIYPKRNRAMPRKRPGSWEGHPHYRWVKMVNGKRHRITCANHLRLPPELWTELGSIQAANDYWDNLEKEVPLQERITELAGGGEQVVKSFIQGHAAAQLMGELTRLQLAPETADTEKAILLARQVNPEPFS